MGIIQKEIIMIKLKDLLKDILLVETEIGSKYRTTYLGNCIDLINQFGGYDNGSAVEWMMTNLIEDTDVVCISEHDFYTYVNKLNIPKQALRGKNTEYYFIKTHPKHPSGFICNFLLYTDVAANDIHYFFNVRGLLKEPEFNDILPNGYGAGSKMTDS